MKFIMTTIAMLMMLISTAIAEDNTNDTVFFQKNIDDLWWVEGHTYQDNFDRCFMERHWDDGSLMQVVFRFDTEEIYVWLENVSWNIGDEPNSAFTTRVNFNKNNKFVGGGE